MADTSLYDITEVDLLDDLGVDLGLLKSVFESGDTELRCGQSLEGTVDGTDRRAAGGDNNDFVRLVRLWLWWTVSTTQGLWATVLTIVRRKEVDKERMVAVVEWASILPALYISLVSTNRFSGDTIVRQRGSPATR